MRLVAPETITFTQSGFCPGCGHGLAVRLIAEVMEEMGLSENSWQSLTLPVVL